VATVPTIVYDPVANHWEARVRDKMRKLAIPLAVVCLSVVLIGAGPSSHAPSGQPVAAAAGSSLTIPTYDPSASLNSVVNVVGVLTGEANTPAPSISSSPGATLTPEPTPTPMESIEAATAAPRLTPPPTTSMIDVFADPSGSGLLALLICLMVGLIGFFVVRRQRATIRG
jgi:hypothetical protein